MAGEDRGKAHSTALRGRGVDFRRNGEPEGVLAPEVGNFRAAAVAFIDGVAGPVCRGREDAWKDQQAAKKNRAEAREAT